MGVYAEITVADPQSCRVSEESTDAELLVVDRTSRGDETSVTAFSPTGEVPEPPNRLCRTKNGTFHRFAGASSGPCPCDLLSDFEQSYSTIRARDSVLDVSIYTNGRPRLEQFVDRCRATTGTVRVRRLVDSRSVPFRGDRRRSADVLTDRQEEVLATAYDIGYYSAPRESNLSDVAERLDVHYSTVRQHLVAAERKIVTDLFGDRSD